MAPILSLIPTSQVRAYVYSCNSHTDNGDGTCTATINDPYEDGNVIVSFTTEKDTTGTSIITNYANAPSTTRGYIEWDISEIPDGSTIEEAYLLYEGTSNDPSVSILVQLSPYRPSSRTASQLASDFTNSTVDYVDPWEPIIGTNQSQDLGAQAATDIENHLSSDWFAIGMDLDPPWTFDDIDSIYSEDFAGATPEPTLEVTYTPPPYYQVDNLETTLIADDTLDRDIRVGSDYGLRGSNIVSLKKESISFKIADFPNVNFISSDLDWQNLSANASHDLSKSYVHISNDIEGFSGDFTLFVPRKAGHDRVRVCPHAANLSEVTLFCSDGFNLYDGQTYNGVTAQRQSGRWRLNGISSTGGISFMNSYYQELLATTGQAVVDYFFFLVGSLALTVGFFFLSKTNLKPFSKQL